LPSIVESEAVIVRRIFPAINEHITMLEAEYVKRLAKAKGA
jgi:hypothetical protein